MTPEERLASSLRDFNTDTAAVGFAEFTEKLASAHDAPVTQLPDTSDTSGLGDMSQIIKEAAKYVIAQLSADDSLEMQMLSEWVAGELAKA